MELLDLTFLGTAGSAPTARRGLPATLVRCGGDRLLFDCGEGTQRQMIRSVGLVPVDCVFVTHFHVDHFLGLPGLLKTYGLVGRTEPLRLYGPPGLRQLFGDLHPVIGRTAFDVVLTELEPHESVDRDGYRVEPYAVEHGPRAYGYVVAEADRPGRFDADAAAALGVAEGPDFGRLQRGEAVTGTDGAEVHAEQVVGEARRGRKLVLTGDTAPCELTRLAAWEADVLVHEATFAEEDAARARETGHSTARAAAELAASATVLLLALTHLSQRYPPTLIEEEARALFADTVVPRDFDTIEVPLPERGPPKHVHGGARERTTPAS